MTPHTTPNHQAGREDTNIEASPLTRRDVLRATLSSLALPSLPTPGIAAATSTGVGRTIHLGRTMYLGERGYDGRRFVELLLRLAVDRYTSYHGGSGPGEWLDRLLGPSYSASGQNSPLAPQGVDRNMLDRPWFFAGLFCLGPVLDTLKGRNAVTFEKLHEELDRMKVGILQKFDSLELDQLRSAAGLSSEDLVVDLDPHAMESDASGSMKADADQIERERILSVLIERAWSKRCASALGGMLTRFFESGDRFIRIFEALMPEDWTALEQDFCTQHNNYTLDDFTVRIAERTAPRLAAIRDEIAFQEERLARIVRQIPDLSVDPIDIDMALDRIDELRRIERALA